MTDKRASQLGKLFLLLAFITYTCSACKIHFTQHTTFKIIATGGGVTHSVTEGLTLR